MKIYCCGCKKEVDARLVNGKTIYPHRYDLFSKKFYMCPDCNLYVGCHPNTDRPLGIIPTKEIMYMRKRIHSILDPLWKSGFKSRKWFYREISKRLGVSKYHTGNTRSVEECQSIYKIILDLKAKLRM